MIVDKCRATLSQTVALFDGKLRKGQGDSGGQIPLECGGCHVSRPVGEVQARGVEGPVHGEDGLRGRLGEDANGQAHGDSVRLGSAVTIAVSFTFLPLQLALELSHVVRAVALGNLYQALRSLVQIP